MRRAIVLLLLAASGCLDLDHLGHLHDFGLDVGMPEDLGEVDGAPSTLVTWTQAATNSPPGQSLCVAVDPVTPATVYVGMVISGVYKSTDGGATWVKSSTGLPAFAIDTLVIDPTATGTLYAGTAGGGVYKSTDGAASWKPANAAFTTTTVYSIAIDSSAPASLYVGDEAGTRYSADGGATWSTIATGVGAKIHAVAIAHSSPTTILAGSLTNGVAISTNGGAKWSVINTGLADIRVAAVAVDPRSATNYYASTVTGLYHYDGAKWVATGPSGVPFQFLAFDPVNSSTVYATAFSIGMYHTTNAGTSWTELSTAASVGFVFGVAIDPVATSTLYAATLGVSKSTNSGAGWTASSSGINNTMITTLTADPVANDNAYAGTPILGQVLRSTTLPVSWSILNSNLTLAGGISGIAVDATTNTNLYVGTTLAGLAKSTNRGSTWSAANTGLPANAAITAVADDPTTPANVYVGVADQGLYRSSDGALNFAAVDTGLGNVRSIFIDKSNGTVYAGGDGGFDGGTGGGIAVASDGIHFEPANTGLTTSRVEAIVGDSNGNVYAATNGGGVFRSQNGGADWVPINNGLSNTQIVALAIDPAAPAVLYAAVNGAVYETRNSGASWVRAVTGLTNLNVTALAVSSQGNVLAGTDGDGVFIGQ